MLEPPLTCGEVTIEIAAYNRSPPERLNMKKILFAFLLALSTIGAYAQVASPTPEADATAVATPSVQEQIKQLQDQLALAKLKAELATVNATPAAATIINNIVQAPPTIINNNNNNAAPAPASVVVAPVVVEVQPTPAPIVPARSPTAMQWILRVNDAFNNHNGSWVTQFTSGSINYFGHVNTSDNDILRDMANDDNTYLVGHSTYYPNTFEHEVSNEYSSHWTGPMMYDSITLYNEIQERYGRMHRFTERLTVGYTFVNNVTTIYALVMKVL
jgi:hypothetical protein